MTLYTPPLGGCEQSASLAGMIFCKQAQLNVPRGHLLGSEDSLSQQAVRAENTAFILQSCCFLSFLSFRDDAIKISHK